MDQALLLPTVTWIIFLILTILDNRVNTLIKILLGVFPSVYIYLWWSELWLGLKTIFTTNPATLLAIAQETSALVFFSLFWISPLLLFTALSSGTRNKQTLWILIIFSITSLLFYLGTHLQ